MKIDLSDDAKDKLDALIIAGSNIANGLNTLATEVKKHREAMEQQNKSECKCTSD